MYQPETTRVVGHRSHLIVGPDVHTAVSQAMNYLGELDEKRPQILVDLGIDCRRTSMTVVIGHSSLVTAKVTPKDIDAGHRSVRFV